MPRLAKDDKESVINFINENGLVRLLNTHLKSKGLLDFEVEFVKIRRKEAITCKPHQTKIEVCSDNGVCREICYPPD